MDEPPFGHESSAVSVRRILVVGALLATLVIVVATLIHISLKRWIVPSHSEVVARRSAVPPPPRLQPNPALEMNRFRQEKEDLLSTWQWTDQTRGFARIPIDRAVALYLSQHTHRTDQSHSEAQNKPHTRGARP